MDVGMMMVFASYGWDNCSDGQVWDEEIRLARLAADLGFDCLWSAEHHFNDYSFVPDNIQLMTYLTALCPNIDVGTAAVILPWHDPLRVAENAAVLDMLCKGRLRLRHGPRPGAARVRRLPPQHGQIARPLRRGRADDHQRAEDRLHGGRRQVLQAAAHRDPPAAAALLRRPHLCRGVERGFGPLGRQTRRPHGDVRRPAVGDAAAGDRAWPGAAPAISTAPSRRMLMLTEFCVCGTNLAETEEEARKYQGKFVESNFHHYEFLGEHFKTVKGYDAYQQKAEIARKGGLEGAVNGFMQAASWGTPDKILRGLEAAAAAARRFRAERRIPLRRHALRGVGARARSCSPRRCCRC